MILSLHLFLQLFVVPWSLPRMVLLPPPFWAIVDDQHIFLLRLRRHCLLKIPSRRPELSTLLFIHPSLLPHLRLRVALLLPRVLQIPLLLILIHGGVHLLVSPSSTLSLPPSRSTPVPLQVMLTVPTLPPLSWPPLILPLHIFLPLWFRI